MKIKHLSIVIPAIAILASCGISAKAQTFKPSGKTAEELSTEEITNKAEGDFNEDGSNIDDLDIPDEEKSTTIFIFDDGKFIEQK